MAGTHTFDPAAHGLRVADDPIHRKPRSPSSRKAPKPPFTDAVWWSFQQGKPLEVVIKTASVPDTIRALKRAARYNERTHQGNEVRVQIGVDPALEDDGKTARKGFSLVKFLGHEPFLLGRRISKERLDLETAGDATVAKPSGQRRRTVAKTRASHRKIALRRPVVRAVITPHDPSFSLVGEAGVVVFSR